MKNFRPFRPIYATCAFRLRYREGLRTQHHLGCSGSGSAFCLPLSILGAWVLPSPSTVLNSGDGSVSVQAAIDVREVAKPAIRAWPVARALTPHVFSLAGTLKIPLTWGPHLNHNGHGTFFAVQSLAGACRQYMGIRVGNAC